MTKSRIYRNAEQLVEGDWIETLPGLKGMFSLLLSDLTSGNVSYADRARFYSLITDALDQGGIFCDKVLTHPGPNLSFDGLVEKYSRLPLNLLHINYFSCEMLFCSDLLDLKQLVDTSYFYSILDQRVKNQRVRAFAEHAKMITPPDCLWYYGRKWDQLKQEYCPNLKVITDDEDEPSSPYYGRLRFFTLQNA